MADTGMKDHVYKILDLVGSSEKSIEDAIQKGEQMNAAGEKKAA